MFSISRLSENTLLCVFILRPRSDQLLQKHKCFDLFLLFSLKTSDFIHELHKFALEGQDQRLFFFLYAPRDMKTKHFALPLIYHVVTQKYISKRETWEKGNSQMPLQTPSDKVARE